MPDLRVQKPTDPSRPSGRVVVPLWAVLLLVLAIGVLTFAWWPRAHGPHLADFDPATEQSTVLRFAGRTYVPVSNAAEHQVVIPAGQVRVVGHAQGHAIYARTDGLPAGGGGGKAPESATPVSPRPLYLRSGNTVYVPLVSRGVTTP